MRRIAGLGLTLALLCLATACTTEPAAGVPHELTVRRNATISDVRYELHFDLFGSAVSEVPATETVTLELKRPEDIVLDYVPLPESQEFQIVVNGDSLSAVAVNEHLCIPRKYTRKGTNTISLAFRADGCASLNRREEFLYTLLVPDRARTLFPCFDQPDLKARYTLSLSVPDDWTAVSNTYIAEETPADEGRKTIRFAETEPLSTYLFSFVAGRFERAFAERDGRTISMYFRETDPVKLAQQPDIFALVFDALNYMEDYTGIPYPFAKYDFIVLPDFQYGGMEHTGATLYNDRRIFLGEKPTAAELLDRAQLIAHETAHMWFGDYVTMKWFNDVWTKEVFANWFAARIVRPAFPEINHRLGDLKSYYAPAYAEDRTVGSNAIQRPLDNLSNAGLIYCNIIYDKAPVVMDYLAQKMGPEPFRRGLQQYLRQFAYGNATWDDLVAILDREADFDVDAWSRTWVKEPGMPEVPFAERPEGAWIPEVDGVVYGCYLLEEADAEACYAQYASLDETARLEMLMNLYENVWRRRVDASRFVEWASGALATEKNSLIFGSLLGYAEDALRISGGCTPALEQALYIISADPKQPHDIRLQAFRGLCRTATDPRLCERLYEVWERQQPFPGLSLGENDYTSLSYQLMLRYPDRADNLRTTQRSRIQHPDRLETFDFVVRAAAPEQADRERFFQSLLQVENRRPESRVLSALDLLCHPLRGEEAVAYIRPALEILPEIQRTGDIFFPASWCKRILGPQTSVRAKEEVEAFLASHEEMHPLLRTKILQAAGYLLQ